MTKLDNAIRSKKFDVINSKKAAKRLAEELMGKKKGNQCEDELQLMAKADVSLATQVDLLAMIEVFTCFIISSIILNLNNYNVIVDENHSRVYRIYTQ